MESNRINHNMVVLARESRGMTQADLAQAAETNQGKMGRIELDIPTEVPDILVENFSKILHYPVSFFYEKGDIFHSLAPFNYRKRAAYTAKLQKMAEAKANIQRLHVQKLLMALSVETNILQLDLDDFDDKPEEVAKAVRQYWKIPKGPIKNVVRLLEKAGIIIIGCDFGSSQLDAFTIFDGIIQPLIFINKKSSGDRMRFTLAHELGHIVMHKYQSQNMEEQADAFAAEFLMPSQDIRHQLAFISLSVLATLKMAWKASMASLLYRAKTLGTITDNQYRYLWIQMSKAGYKTREPVSTDIPCEVPELLTDLIKVHLEDLKLGIPELSQKLHLFPDEFRDLYFYDDSKNGGLKPLFKVN